MEPIEKFEDEPTAFYGEIMHENDYEIHVFDRIKTVRIPKHLISCCEPVTPKIGAYQFTVPYWFAANNKLIFHI